jgi:hypothetical protein
MITLVFTSKRSIGSILVRLFTWSSWSHVGFLTPDGDIIEAQFRGGVRRVSLSNMLKGTNKHAFVNFKDYDPVEFQRILLTKIGSKYDIFGAIGIGLKKKLGIKDAYSCGDLIAWGFQAMGKPLFRESELVKISQEDLWRIHPDGSTSVIKD